MPNTGKPSKDCHLCRSRRVKCDLGRPACQRCVKYGAECPGYRDEQELVFHSYLHGGSQHGPKRRKKRASRAEGQASGAATPLSLGQQSESSTSTSPSLTSAGSDYSADDAQLVPASSIAPPLDQHWTAQSIPILLNVYASLEFLDRVYHDYPADGPLVWAAHLFSRTYVTNVSHPTSIRRDAHEDTERELRTYLGRALRSVRDALQAPDGALRDDVLATVWILANYELLVGSLNNSRALSPWHLHSRGLCSILRSRGSSMFYSEAGRVAFWSAYNMVQIEALVTSSECPPESRQWLATVRSIMHPTEHAPLLVSSFIVEVASVQSRMLAILRDADGLAASAEYGPLIDSLRRADAEVAAGLGRGSQPHFLDLYWIQMYRAAQVKAYHIAHLLATFLTHQPRPRSHPATLEQLQDDRRECLEMVWRASEAILDDVHHFLGSVVAPRKGPGPPAALFDALKMIWPLTVIYIIPSTTQELQDRAHGWLVLVGRELGIRQALHLSPQHAMSGVPDEAQRPFTIQ